MPKEVAGRSSQRTFKADGMTTDFVVDKPFVSPYFQLPDDDHEFNAAFSQFIFGFRRDRRDVGDLPGNDTGIFKFFQSGRKDFGRDPGNASGQFIEMFRCHVVLAEFVKDAERPFFADEIRNSVDRAVFHGHQFSLSVRSVRFFRYPDHEIQKVSLLY